MIRETGKTVLGVSSGRKTDKETWWWNEEIWSMYRERGLLRRSRTLRTEESRQEYGEMQCKLKVQVAKDKQRAYDDLYARFDSKEGETDLHRLTRQRDRDGKDVQQARVIKDSDGNVVTDTRNLTGR